MLYISPCCGGFIVRGGHNFPYTVPQQGCGVPGISGQGSEMFLGVPPPIA